MASLLPKITKVQVLFPLLVSQSWRAALICLAQVSAFQLAWRKEEERGHTRIFQGHELEAAPVTAGAGAHWFQEVTVHISSHFIFGA